MKRFLLLAMAACLAWCMPAMAGDAAEESTIEWSQRIYHKVQKGDTLWDLSEKYFDTPAMWPEVWSQNREISNPHWIYPGEIISLYGVMGDIYKPEPGPKKDTIKPLETPVFNFPYIKQAGFIRKNPVEALGRIVKAYQDKVVISQGDTVYIEPKPGVDFVEGERYTLYRLEGIVENPYASEENRAMGVQHRILGEVALTQVRPEVLVGQVEQAYRTINTGDLLMVYRKIPQEDITIEAGKVGLTGNVVMEEDHNAVIGDGDVVFIDRGHKDGLQTGQVYTTFIESEPVNMVPIPPVDVGEILVLLTEENNATALVTRAVDVLEPGIKFYADDLPRR